MISRPAYLSAEERCEVTVETVIDLAAEQNPADITTGAIAKRMGVTQGALFRHFPSKDAILQAVMERLSERLLARINKATSSLGALEAAFTAHIEFISEHPGVPRMLFGELQRAEQTVARRMAPTLIQRYGERLGRLIAEGKERGELAPTLEETVAATLFIGTIQGLVMQSLIVGNVKRFRASAPGAFALYRRAVEAAR
ncbi:transcriptional regulator [Afipia carboxidovorans OM5]|uniref:Putative transcriptional regulatory protein n=1 Tax=Afipia carboxidovorans (strain ATCC 49405 / DSM 1227 / KCTC 32145 / OM5) TaxID=504832 RepID=B6JDQ6_AFIC5|nr:TetR/AcrR family transcriptional regulator [Afipia carboxidovorans]ACI91986.1 transcriptional regulator [Afipia carboxidovorans OM5]AEI04156.1 putative transcriptional regulatory protein [Afipia carboxidovorans OM4]AEI07786.1 putative transcriptional regulatory protein [Afipia carboxidovorans OM5]